MTVSVLVPYRPDGGHRERSWRWIRERWQRMLPDFELVESGDDGGEHPGRFNHPLAINRAAARATGDVFIVADADTAFDPAWCRQAVRAVRFGVPWVLPRLYHKMSVATSEALFRVDPCVDIEPGVTEWTGDSVSVSGLVVMPREGFETVGGYDERFTHWGADDVCFATTMTNLWGPVTRIDGAAFHLWHPTSLDETYGHERHRPQHRLMKLYLAADGRPDVVRRIRFGRKPRSEVG